jgi:hypothetical protein
MWCGMRWCALLIGAGVAGSCGAGSAGGTEAGAGPGPAPQAEALALEVTPGRGADPGGGRRAARPLLDADRNVVHVTDASRVLAIELATGARAVTLR